MFTGIGVQNRSDRVTYPGNVRFVKRLPQTLQVTQPSQRGSRRRLKYLQSRDRATMDDFALAYCGADARTVATAMSSVSMGGVASASTALVGGVSVAEDDSAAESTSTVKRATAAMSSLSLGGGLFSLETLSELSRQAHKAACKLVSFRLPEMVYGADKSSKQESYERCWSLSATATFLHVMQRDPGTPSKSSALKTACPMGQFILGGTTISAQKKLGPARKELDHRPKKTYAPRKTKLNLKNFLWSRVIGMRLC
ncbi:hypothetical protein B0H14DRAFT_2596463 [Mycena olivaceomarginata]|nr:hypothetical protein B0H14DRAFT_2596463 [Mycena olivaceomarginata]